MPWSGRRGKNAERLPYPGLRRPSNPTMVAKASSPAMRPAAASSRRARGSRKGGAPPVRAPLPASVTMGPARVLGEAEAPRRGVLYRLVVCDADGKPIASSAYKIRRHVLLVSASGCFARDDAKGRISLVPLDTEACGHVLVEGDAPSSEREGVASAPSASSGGAPPRGGRAAGRAAKGAAEGGEEATFEYFSFEHGGVTYAIPQSGYLVERKRRGRRVEVTRTPRAGGSIHGAVVQGLVRDGGADGYSFPA
jgi:hypothetical protein